MSNSTQTWKQWVQDFKHGRTHVAYGLMAGIVSSGYILVTTSALDVRIASLISFAGSLGGLVDTVAHLYYH